MTEDTTEYNSLVKDISIIPSITTPSSEKNSRCMTLSWWQSNVEVTETLVTLTSLFIGIYA